MDYYYVVDTTPSIVDGKPAAEVFEPLKTTMLCRDNVALNAARALDVHLYNGNMVACIVNVESRKDPTAYLAYKVSGKVRAVNLRKSLAKKCRKDEVKELKIEDDYYPQDDDDDCPLVCDHCNVTAMLGANPPEHLPVLPSEVETIVREKLDIPVKVAEVPKA